MHHRQHLRWLCSEYLCGLNNKVLCPRRTGVYSVVCGCAELWNTNVHFFERVWKAEFSGAYWVMCCYTFWRISYFRQPMQCLLFPLKQGFMWVVLSSKDVHVDDTPCLCGSQVRGTWKAEMGNSKVNLTPTIVC